MIVIRMVVVVVVVLMVMMVISLGVQVGGDVFVNCDRRFGRWGTRRFLPVCGGRGGSDQAIELVPSNYIL
jgi:hypothetical protein